MTIAPLLNSNSFPDVAELQTAPTYLDVAELIGFGQGEGMLTGSHV
jgi:hypothetical protein